MCFHATSHSHQKYYLTFQTDPFRSVSKLSEEEIDTARSQTVPSLLQLLNLAMQYNISVIFDLYSPDKENDTEDVVDTILSSGIDPTLVSLIVNPPIYLSEQFHNRSYFNKVHILLFIGSLASSNKTGICKEGGSRLHPGL